MKILAVSDHESEYLWDYYEKSKLEGIDLILSCGDLDPHYLSFLATLSHADVLYVHGNHDDRYATTPPEGCICIEDQVYNYKGLRILGLGGSMRYRDGANQYSQLEMNWRYRKLWLPLARSGGFDILLTHAPAAGLGDGIDLPHMGFTTFIQLLDKYSPAYFIHGHVHLNYDYKQKRIRSYKDTTVINAYERYVFDVDPDSLQKQQNSSFS